MSDLWWLAGIVAVQEVLLVAKIYLYCARKQKTIEALRDLAQSYMERLASDQKDVSALAEMKKIVEGLASTNPTMCIGDIHDEQQCALCEGQQDHSQAGNGNVAHEDNCPWVLANALRYE